MPLLDIAVGLALVATVGSLLVIYNRLVALRNDCDRAFANIDVLLRQRCDELPNLAAVCRGYMLHEQETLKLVTEARSRTSQARTPSEADRATLLVNQAFGELLATVEAYPDLKASEPVLALQKRITGLENEIADRREYFNHTVTAWNTRIEQLPDVFVAGLLRARRRSTLKLDGIAPVAIRLAA
jgi:LemA protein